MSESQQTSNAVPQPASSAWGDFLSSLTSPAPAGGSATSALPRSWVEPDPFPSSAAAAPEQSDSPHVDPGQIATGDEGETQSTESNSPEGEAKGTEQQPESPSTKEWTRLEKERRSLAAKEKELAEKETEFAEAQAAAQSFAELQQLAKENRPALLQKLGIDIEELIVDVIKGGTAASDEPKPLDEDKVANIVEQRLAKEREEADKKAQEQWAEQVTQQHKAKIRDFVDADPDAFEALRAHDAVDLVWDLIEHDWLEQQRQPGTTEKDWAPMSIDVAAKRVEELLEERDRQQLQQLQSRKKFAAKPAEQSEQAAAPAAAPQAALPKPPVPPSLTTTPADTANVAKVLPPSQQIADEEEAKRVRFLRQAGLIP